MIYLGEVKAGTVIFYAANFHNDLGTLEDPTSLEAQGRDTAGTWSALAAPTKQNAKTGHYGGTLDTTSFSAGQYAIRMSGAVTTGKVVATEFTFLVVANTAKEVYDRVGAPAGASVSADMAAVKVDTAAVKVKTDFLPSITAGASGGVFIAGANAATSITTALTANITGNLSGSVGSVTGDVNINLSQALSALTGSPTTIGGSLYFSRQVMKNKLSYNKSTDVMTLYEDDGTTAKLAFTMTDNAGEATRGAGA